MGSGDGAWAGAAASGVATPPFCDWLLPASAETLLGGDRELPSSTCSFQTPVYLTLAILSSPSELGGTHDAVSTSAHCPGSGSSRKTGRWCGRHCALRAGGLGFRPRLPTWWLSRAGRWGAPQVPGARPSLGASSLWRRAGLCERPAKFLSLTSSRHKRQNPCLPPGWTPVVGSGQWSYGQMVCVVQTLGGGLGFRTPAAVGTAGQACWQSFLWAPWVESPQACGLSISVFSVRLQSCLVSRRCWLPSGQYCW